jgi:RimJ/RimL family protein N-acetyltransferase
MMHVKTKRLLIRSIQPADARALAEIWSDPAVTRYMGGPRDYETLLKDFKDEARAGQPDPFDLWPVIEIATDKVIGHCGLLEKEVDGQPEIELIYVFSAPAWGKRYATEAALALRDYAFGMPGVNRIIALIDPDNQPSSQVARKVGMQFEKETVRGNDKLMQVYAMQKP